MNLDDWHAALDERPVTAHQRGAIMRECGRLGLRDRGERLAVLAALLGLGELGSTADLTQGQGGKAVGILQRIRDRSELPGPDADGDVDEDQADEPGDLDDEPVPGARGMTLGEALRRFAVLLLLAFPEQEAGADDPGAGRAASALRECMRGMSLRARPGKAHMPFRKLSWPTLASMLINLISRWVLPARPFGSVP